MKKLILSIAALALFATTAFAERYVMITHGEGKDPFWPVVQKGGEDAARAIGADFEYIYTFKSAFRLLEVGLPPPNLWARSNPKGPKDAQGPVLVTAPHFLPPQTKIF